MRPAAQILLLIFLLLLILFLILIFILILLWFCSLPSGHKHADKTGHIPPIHAPVRVHVGRLNGEGGVGCAEEGFDEAFDVGHVDEAAAVHIAGEAGADAHYAVGGGDGEVEVADGIEGDAVDG